MFHINRTHLGELDKMRRPGIHVRAAVQKQRHSLLCRNQRGKRRSFHALDPPYQRLAPNQDSAGTSCRHECVRPARLHHLHTDHNRGIFLPANSVHRRFRRLDHLRGMDHFNLRLVKPILRKLPSYDLFLSDQEYLHGRLFLGGVHRPFHHLSGSVVPAHGI